MEGGGLKLIFTHIDTHNLQDKLKDIIITIILTIIHHQYWKQIKTRQFSPDLKNTINPTRNLHVTVRLRFKTPDIIRCEFSKISQVKFSKILENKEIVSLTFVTIVAISKH